MPTTTISTTLLESVNIVLANLGESPVNILSTDARPQQVSLVLNTIEEVSTDIQSKGWWFNRQTAGAYDVDADVVIYPSDASNDWSPSVPEEARRYITIRASRITQTRLIGSEELQKFSYPEELVSLAILQQAHVRNSGGVLDFNDFPEELRGLGIDEVMFLQGNVEDKIGTLRLGSELAAITKTKAETALLAQNAIKVAVDSGFVTSQQALIAQQVLDVVADTALKGKQGLKIDQETDLVEAQEELTDAQKATEIQNAIKVAAEAGLVTTQQALIAQQVLDTAADIAIKGSQKLKIEGETDLVTEQKTLVTKQALTEVQNAIKVSADSGLVTAQQALVSQQVLDAAADIALKGKQGSLVDAQVTTEGKRPADVQADTTLKGSQSSLVTAQALTEAQNAIKVAADAGLVTTQQALISQQVLDVAADIALKSKQGSLLDTQALDVEADTTLKGKQGELVDTQALDVAADTALKSKQGELVDAQATTEAQNAIKVAVDAGLVTTQQALVAQQVLESVANVSNITADVALKGKQSNLVEKQALDVEADTALKGLQGSLVGAQTTDVAADTALKGKQGIKLDADTGLTTQQQALTAQQTLDVVADTAVKGEQKSLLGSQKLKTDADKLLVDAQATTEGSQQSSLDAQATKFTGEGTLATNQAALIVAQKDQLIAQTALEATAEKAFFDAGGVSISGQIKSYRDFSAEMRMMGFQETQFQGMPAYKKVELIKDANKLRLATATETGDATELAEVNKVMRFIGEPPVAATRKTSLASECLRLLRDTDTELQGRGWWFNTEMDVELTPTSGGVILLVGDELKALSVEVNDYDTRIETTATYRRLYDRKEKSALSFTSPVKAKVIYQHDLIDTPTKYREYLSVRVAILLTELYPQSGIDIQRLPKMEAELRAYFKDREADDANYSIFDNPDTANRIGINRNYNII